MHKTLSPPDVEHQILIFKLLRWLTLNILENISACTKPSPACNLKKYQQVINYIRITAEIWPYFTNNAPYLKHNSCVYQLNPLMRTLISAPPYSFSKVQSCKCQYWLTVRHSKSIASSLPEAAACKTGACLREQKAPKQLLKVTLNNITHKRAFKWTQKFYYDNSTITEREVFWGC